MILFITEEIDIERDYVGILIRGLLENYPTLFFYENLLGLNQVHMHEPILFIFGVFFVVFFFVVFLHCVSSFINSFIPILFFFLLSPLSDIIFKNILLPASARLYRKKNYFKLDLNSVIVYILNITNILRILVNAIVYVLD